MYASSKVYPVGHYIPIAFNIGDPVQAQLLEGFKASFGENYARDEDIVPPHERLLVIHPSGLSEVQR